MRANSSATREFYRSVREEELCACGYCRSCRARIRAAYPDAAAYLDALGVDVEKPLETSPLEPDENGMLEYGCCQHIVFGSCEAGYRRRVGTVEVRAASSYPPTGVEQEHFVLDLFPIRLPYAP